VAERETVEEQLAELTPKERQVVEMIAEGKSKEAIASEVGVSVRTIELHRNRVIKKLGLGSLTELVVFALTACDGHSQPPHEMQAV
jgi:DNA-binding NarL/FixJ family response regulator